MISKTDNKRVTSGRASEIPVSSVEPPRWKPLCWPVGGFFVNQKLEIPRLCRGWPPALSHSVKLVATRRSRVERSLKTRHLSGADWIS